MHTNWGKNLVVLHPVKLSDSKIQFHIKSAWIKFRGILHGKVISDRRIEIPSQFSSATEEIEHIAHLKP